MMKNFIEAFREYSKDNQEPYFFEEKEIQNNLDAALKLYSSKKPILRECNIVIVEGQKIYALPEDYQTWYKGLEKYDVVGNCIVLKNSFCGTISFLYYADRIITEIPEKELYLFYNYCLGEMMYKKVMNITEDNIAEGIVKEMKLGRGLDLTFEENKNAREILLDYVQNKRLEFLNAIKGKATGSWC
mgnify:FL=1